ncbi:unnamed protein product [Arabidopsis halleri]
MGFVDRVLSLLGNSAIRKFSLKCEADASPVRVNRWLCQVLQRGVSDLDLTIDFEDDYHLPQEMFIRNYCTRVKCFRCSIHLKTMLIWKFISMSKDKMRLRETNM